MVLPGVPTSIHCMISSLGLWPEDASRTYAQLRFFTCSLTNVIYAYDYDEGTLSNKRIFSDTSKDSAWESSKPDGLCMDDEGFVWSARRAVIPVNQLKNQHLMASPDGMALQYFAWIRTDKLTWSSAYRLLCVWQLAVSVVSFPRDSS